MTRRRYDSAAQCERQKHKESETPTIPSVVVHPLRIHHVVHSHHVIVLRECTTADAAKLLHVAADAENKTEVNTERPDVRASLARGPEDGEVPLLIKLEQVALVHSPDPQLALHGRDERWPLEKRAGHGLQRTRERGRIRERVVQAKDTDILLTCAHVVRLSMRASCRERGKNAPAPCWDLTSRVARSMQTIRQPVTLGSRVPEWPVLSTRRMRRSQATTSCEDGFEGLSRLMTPDFTYDVMSRLSGEQPEGMGVKWLERTSSLS
jgi:hypothetical protein